MNDGQVQNWRKIRVEFAVMRFDVEVLPATTKRNDERAARRTALFKKEERKQL